MMRRLMLFVGALLLALPAYAQVSGLRVVTACGSMAPWPSMSALITGGPGWLAVDPNGNFCTSGSGGGGGVITGPLGNITATASLAATLNYGAGAVNGGNPLPTHDTGANANGAATAANSSPTTPANLAPGSAAIATSQFSCLTSSGSTIALAARTGLSGTGRISATMTNTTGTDKVCFGNTGVTTSTGQCLPAVAGASMTLNTTAALYCIVPTTTQVVSFVETY